MTRLGVPNAHHRIRWLFALEGTLTGIIGIVTYFYLPPSPTQTASWFRGKNGWFSEREEKIMVNRILRDGKRIHYEGCFKHAGSIADILLRIQTQAKAICTIGKASPSGCSGTALATIISGRSSSWVSLGGFQRFRCSNTLPSSSSLLVLEVGRDPTINIAGILMNV